MINEVSAKTEKRLARYEKQVSVFARSSAVKQYLIGITANEKSRRAAYDREDFDYFVLLETGLTRDEALELERHLFDRLRNGKKYHSEKKLSPYRKSSGGQVGQQYSLYIAAY